VRKERTENRKERRRERRRRRKVYRSKLFTFIAIPKIVVSQHLYLCEQINTMLQSHFTLQVLFFLLFRLYCRCVFFLLLLFLFTIYAACYHSV